MGHGAQDCSSKLVDRNSRSCLAQMLLGSVTARPQAPSSSNPFLQEAVRQAPRHSNASFPAEPPQYFLSAGMCSGLPPVPGKLPLL